MRNKTKTTPTALCGMVFLGLFTLGTPACSGCDDDGTDSASVAANNNTSSPDTDTSAADTGTTQADTNNGTHDTGETPDTTEMPDVAQDMPENPEGFLPPPGISIGGTASEVESSTHKGRLFIGGLSIIGNAESDGHKAQLGPAAGHVSPDALNP